MHDATWTRKGVPAKVWRFLVPGEWKSQRKINEYITDFNEQYGRRWHLGWRESGAQGVPFPTLNLLHLPTGRRYEYHLLYDDRDGDGGPLYSPLSGCQV